jgi:hypothetical protein
MTEGSVEIIDLAVARSKCADSRPDTALRIRDATRFFRLEGAIGIGNSASMSRRNLSSFVP